MNKIKKLYLYKFLRNIYYSLRSSKFNFFYNDENYFSILYEKIICPFITKFLYYPYIPIEKILIKKKKFFLFNISAGTGHVAKEFDAFYKYYHLRKKLKNRKIYWITKNHYLFKTVKKKYEIHFPELKIIINNFLYYLLLPIFMKNNVRLIYDSGFGLSLNIKYKNKAKTLNRGVIYAGNKFRSLSGFTRKQAYYSKCAHKLDSIFYQKTLISSELKKIINDKIDSSKKTVLIHLKEIETNQVAKLTDPVTYLLTLKYLSKKYNLIFVGRESMPKIFEDYIDFNYSESNIATFDNDIELFKFADFAIINGSGLALLSDKVKTPFLLINYWHLPFQYFSKLNLLCPSLMMTGKKYLSFKDMIRLRFQNIENNCQDFKKYQIRNLSESDIYEAFIELENKNLNQDFEFSDLQKKFNNLLIPSIECAVSDKFLTKFEKYLF